MESSSSSCQIFNADCLEKMKDLDDNSVDLIFCDLPYGQTSCKWDCCIDLEAFWKQVMRIKKLNTPIFMTTTTKFGVSLIQSAPKKCFFRYDLVWVKSAPAGFLSAKKMPMRKHEMVYVFYEKLPFYDLSSHQHNDPPLPVSVVKEDITDDCYNMDERHKNGKMVDMRKTTGYDPPLPVSVVKEDVYNSKERFKNGKLKKNPRHLQKGDEPIYDPPLPVSVVKEVNRGKNYYPDLKQTAYQDPALVMGKEWKEKQGGVKIYDPPLPVSVVKEGEMTSDFTPNKNGNIYDCPDNQEFKGRNGQPRYDPPLPTTMLEIKSTRGKHSTEKPVQLMQWIFKYYSKEGDVILDPTMGSGSTGVACKNMNRNFIGIEMDKEIFKVAEERLK